MKFCLALFFALIGLVNSRPQDYGDELYCSDLEKPHRCVPEANCLSSNGFLEDEIFSGVQTGSYYWPLKPTNVHSNLILKGFSFQKWMLNLLEQFVTLLPTL